MNYIDELEREKAHADQMADMAQLWMDRAQWAERTLAVVVKAAGGKVVVPRDDLIDGPRLELVKLQQDWDMTVHFIARTIPGDPNQ